MSNEFQLHPRLAADGLVLGDFPLCRLLMMNDRQYPWFILVPRIAELTELHHLHSCELSQFWRESRQLSTALENAFHGDKLNVAAIGNLVPQLHVHHVVRYCDDACWPAPIWGQRPPVAMTAQEQQLRAGALKATLEGEFDWQPQWLAEDRL